MLKKYNEFNKITMNEGVILDDIDIKDIDKMIDDAYENFKKINKKVNTLDIIEYVEDKIGKELDDDDYNELYYRITGEEYDDVEISDLDEEEKFYIK